MRGEDKCRTKEQGRQKVRVDEFALEILKNSATQDTTDTTYNSDAQKTV